MIVQSVICPKSQLSPFFKYKCRDLRILCTYLIDLIHNNDSFQTDFRQNHTENYKIYLFKQNCNF